MLQQHTWTQTAVAVAVWVGRVVPVQWWAGRKVGLVGTRETRDCSNRMQSRLYTSCRITTLLLLSSSLTSPTV